MGLVTCVGVQQGTVPKWYQTGVSAGGQLLKMLQVGGLLNAKLWLHSIAGHPLCIELCEVPIEQLVAGEIHYLKGSYAVL